MVTVNISVGAAGIQIILDREASVVVGDAVFVNTGGKVAKADASSVTTTPVAGFVEQLVGATQAKITRQGKFADFAGLSLGGKVFLSTVAGDITQTPPTGSGEVVQELGVAISITEILILLDADAVVNT